MSNSMEYFMSSIAGFFSPHTTFPKENSFCRQTIQHMSEALVKRGPDRQGTCLFSNGAFSQNELSCCHIHPDIPCEPQPVTKTLNKDSFTLLYDGYISNLPQLRRSMEQDQINTSDLSQEELILCAFIRYGPDFVKKLSGAFAMAVYDSAKKLLYLFRDPLGLRPLYYTVHNDTLVFASELKGIFAYPGIEPALDLDGLNEIFSMGPAHSPGCGVFKDVCEIRPGHLLVYGSDRLFVERYHRFSISEHSDSYEDTLFRVKELLDKSIRTLACTNTAPASLLSGGLDSSVITACLVRESTGDEPLKTFSFELKGSRNHFRPNSFQPALDAPFVHQMADALSTDHTTLVCSNAEQFEYLKNSVDAHDLPAMADIDSSLIYFCEKIAPQNRIAFTGECADELFCGYPWYHRKEMYTANTFPWSLDLSFRKNLLKDDLINKLHMDEYINEQYLAACRDLLSGADPASSSYLHQKTMYLTIRFFMQTLVDRTDRTASCNSMDIRVPFADLALAEYLFEVPYEMKTKNGEIKHLLREFARGLLPEQVRTRQKSPYPKTYDPGYERLLSSALFQVASDPNSPILSFMDKKKLISFCQRPKDYGKPWFGQLMAAPQLMAYYLQINYWLTKYQIKLDLS